MRTVNGHASGTTETPWRIDETFADFLLNSPDGVVLIDEEGIVRAWNPGQERISGIGTPEALGQSITDILDLLPGLTNLKAALSDPQSWLKRPLNAPTNSPPSRYEDQIHCLDGTTRTVETHFFPVDADNRRLLACVTRDISRRTEAKDDLQLSLLNLQILEQIDRAILTKDSPEQIADAVLDKIRQLAGNCTRASFILYDTVSEEAIWLAVETDKQTQLQTGTRTTLDYLGEMSMMWREPGFIYVPDLHAMENPAAIDRQLMREGMRSYVVVPLLHDDTLFGSLNLASDVAGAFSDELIGNLRRVVGSLAVALQDALLAQRLQNAHRRLQALSHRLVEAQEAERRRIARELHDDIGQTLTAVKLNLQSLAATQSTSQVEQLLTDSIEITDQALQEVRNLSMDLRPSLLDDLGLVATLRWYLDRQQVPGSLSIKFRSDLAQQRLSPELEVACFRIVQEAMTNIVRHAHARHVTVELRQKDSRLSLSVSDDGTGFDTQAALNGPDAKTNLGLLGMQERVSLHGGQIQFRSSPGAGTKLDVEFPIKTARPTESQQHDRHSADATA